MIGCPDGGVPPKREFSSGPHMLPSPNCKSGSVTHQTVPSGTVHQWPLFQALRTWLPSFCPFGTNTLNTCPQIRGHIKNCFEDEDDDEGRGRKNPIIGPPGSMSPFLTL